MNDPVKVDPVKVLKWVADDIELSIRVKLVQEGIAEVDDLESMIEQALAVSYPKYVPMRFDTPHWRDSRTWSVFGRYMLALSDASAFQRCPKIAEMFWPLPLTNDPSEDKSEYWDEVVNHVVGPPDPMPDDGKWPEQRWLPNLLAVTEWLRTEAVALAGDLTLTAYDLAKASFDEKPAGSEISELAKQFTGKRGVLAELQKHGTRQTGKRGRQPALYLWSDVEKRLFERGDSRETVEKIRSRLFSGQN